MKIKGILDQLCNNFCFVDVGENKKNMFEQLTVPIVLVSHPFYLVVSINF